jgi:hypothetical protein
VKIPFPEVIDSTILGTFRSCPQKFFRMYAEHWKPKGESVHLIAGGAFAKGIEVTRRCFYEDGETPENAVAAGLSAVIVAYGDYQPPEGSAKTLERVCGAFEFYWNQYPLSWDSVGTAIPVDLGNGKRAVEFSFAEPLDFLHPETGNPVLYTGRSDAITAFSGGIYVTDEKTASSLGASWGRQWDLRSQFTGYCWAARNHPAIPKVTGVLVRGVSILKTKYDTQSAITNRSDWEIDRWLKQVSSDLRRMQACWENEYWDFNLDHACAEYGGCAFTSVCKSPDPEIWLPMYFEKRKWDPLAREETLLVAT